jgi:hypothetical protein
MIVKEFVEELRDIKITLDNKIFDLGVILLNK